MFLQCFVLLEDGMTLARSDNRGSRFPFAIHLHPPREIPQASVMIFVELRVADFVGHC